MDVAARMVAVLYTIIARSPLRSEVKFSNLPPFRRWCLHSKCPGRLAAAIDAAAADPIVVSPSAARRLTNWVAQSFAVPMCRTHLVVGRQIHYRWRPGEAVDLLLPGASRGLLAHMGGRLAIVGLVCGALSVVPLAAVFSARPPPVGELSFVARTFKLATAPSARPAPRMSSPDNVRSAAPAPQRIRARPSPSPKHISQPKAHCQL